MQACVFGRAKRRSKWFEVSFLGLVGSIQVHCFHARDLQVLLASHVNKVHPNIAWLDYNKFDQFVG